MYLLTTLLRAPLNTVFSSPFHQLIQQSANIRGLSLQSFPLMTNNLAILS